MSKPRRWFQAELDAIEAGKPAVVPETDVVAEILAACRGSPDVVSWARRMNSGALPTTGKDGRRRLLFFGFKGCADIIGQLTYRCGGRFLAIEAKRQGGKARPHQALFLALVNRAGGLGFVARSADDVFEAFEPFRRRRRRER